MTIRVCVTWRFASPKGYELGRRLFIRTPCRSTMAKYVACVSHGVGITTLIRQRLMIEAAKYQDPKERMVSLISDEMAIRNGHKGPHVLQ
jgi:hypothetical protein